MTPQEKFVNWLLSQVGYTAYNGKHNKYAQAIDKTNGYNGIKDGYDWCEAFYDDGMMECFGLDTAWKMMNQPKGGCGAGCEQSAAQYRAAGQWSTSPSLGAQIYFGTRGDEYHTGGVVAFDSSTVWTVEGNTGYSQGYSGGAVLKQSYSRNSSKIAGYGVPKWSLAGSSVEPNVPASDGKLAVDGIFGPLTIMALQRCLQSHGYYKGYLIDGDFGYYTKLALQKYLRRKGYYTDAYLLDGDFGYFSTKALQTYLRKLGYYTDAYLLDGDWGMYTTMALQKALNAGKF